MEKPIKYVEKKTENQATEIDEDKKKEENLSEQQLKKQINTLEGGDEMPKLRKVKSELNVFSSCDEL